MLASGSNDKTVRLWQGSGSSRIIQGHIEGITSVSFSPDGTILASGSWDKTIRLWRVAEGTQLRILTDYNAQGSDNNVLFRIFNKFSGWVTSVVFSPNGMLLASASENIVWLWNLRNSDQEWQLLKQSWKEKRESAGRCEECGRELDKKEKELGRTICKTCR
jgi:WD40 repeat protein